MAQRSLPSAAEIAEKKKPGWKAVKPVGPVRDFGAAQATIASDAADRTSGKVDAVLPDTAQLLRKYIGSDAADTATPADAVNPDVELVDLKSGDLERTVGVNRRSQKIEWSQG
jgi:hypothetical protein